MYPFMPWQYKTFCGNQGYCSLETAQSIRMSGEKGKGMQVAAPSCLQNEFAQKED
jgi:hypothetical protein